MKNSKFLMYVIVSLIVAGCSTTSSSIITDYDRGASFDQYKTYYWANEFEKGSDTGEKPLFYNSLIQKRLKNAVQKQMQDRGYALNKENPDLLVNVTVQIEKDQTSSVSTTMYPSYAYSPFYPGFGNGFGYYYGFYGTQRASTSSHMAGGLIIELIDRSKRQLVWQGYASDVLHTDTQDKRKELNEAVNNIFSKYNDRLPDQNQQ